MFARLTAKVIFAAAAIAMAFFGIGFLGMALAAALVATLGTVGGYTLASVVFLVPPLLWALIPHLFRRRRPPQQVPNSDLTRVLLAAVAKETPWVAIIGAGIAGAANMFLNRNRTPK